MTTGSSTVASVLMVSGEFPPLLGGIGDYTVRLADALVAEQVDVSLFVPAACEGRATPAPIAGTFDVWSWSTARELYRCLREWGANWLHIQHNASIYGSHPAAYLLPRHLRWLGWSGRIAVTFHDLNRPWLFPKAGRVRDWAVAELARNADVVFAADTGDVEQLRSFGASVHQVPIGSNIPPVGAGYEPESVRRRLRVPEGSFTVGHFGTSLGLDVVLRAVAEMPHAVLVLVGKSPRREGVAEITRLPAPLLALVDDLGIAGRLRWTGHLPAAEVAESLAACDVVTMPYPAGASLRHGGMLAALSQGRAVITSTPARPMPCLAPGDTFLTVPPDDPQALVAAITRVMSDQNLRLRLERSAAAAAGEVFSWEAIAREHTRLYGSFITEAAV